MTDTPARASGQGPGDEVTGAVRPAGGSGGSPPRASGQGPGDEVTGAVRPAGGSGGSPPRASGQGPGDEVTGAVRPAGGSGGSPPRASAVIIGAGIVGNSLVHHLALLGWRDLVLVDKGPMPNPGGSTGHASNFIFPIEYSKMMFELTEDSTAQYQDLGVFTQSGGIELARTPERMIELKRRCSQAKAWGIPAEVITTGEVNKLVPYLDESVIGGGAYFPTVGVVDSLRAGTLMR